MHEASQHQENMYGTLTYDPKFLPKDGSLVLRHVQLFWKRLRLELQPLNVKYFLAGEYGERNDRPHYHFLLFGWQPWDLVPMESQPFPLYDSKFVRELWGMGNVRIGDVTMASAQYVAGYVMKKVDQVGRRKVKRFCDPETGEYREVKAEFSTQSRGARKGARGLGFSWFDQYGEEVERLGSVRMDYTDLPPPRYYDELLRQRDEAVWQLYKLRRQRKHRSKDPDARPAEVRDEEKREAMAREVIAKKRLEMLERRL